MPEVFIIHVGSLNNKGTKALLRTDISLIDEILGEGVKLSVSGTDVKGLKLLVKSSSIFPTMVNVPFEVADFFAMKSRFARDSWSYKIFALGSLIMMPVQMLLSAFSATLLKIGLRPFYRSKLLERMKNCNIIISCSDENFKEGVSLLSSNAYWVLTWWTLLLSRTWDVLIAKFLGKPLIMFPNSVGSFRTLVGRILARLALSRFDCILVREQKSYDILDSMGIQSPKILTADITLLMNATSKASIGDLKRPIIGVCVGVYSHTLSERQTCKFIQDIAEALDETVEKHGFSVVFLPHYVSGFRYDDLEVTQLVFSRMRTKTRAKIINTLNVEDFKCFLSQTDLVLSSKMHPAVLAVGSFVPAVCIAYDDKQIGFFTQLGMTDCLLPINDVSKENLESKIDYVWARKAAIKANLQRRIPVLQANIKEALKRVLSAFT